MLITVLWKQDVGVGHAVDTAVAGMVTLVPEGLVLLLSVTYAAAALGLARRGALAQQLDAIESLASVDTICVDKTGTLTGSELRVLGIVPAEGVEPERLRDALGRYAASSPDRNLTLAALASAVPRSAGGAARDGPVLLGPALERPSPRRRPLRAGRAGAVSARSARRGCAGYGRRAVGAWWRSARRRRASRTIRTAARRRSCRSASPCSAEELRPGRPRDDRVPDAGGDRRQGALRRRAADGRLDRGRCGHPVRDGARRSRATGRSGRARRGRARRDSRRSHLAGGEAGGRRRADGRGPLRGDGRGRRQRCSRAQGGAARRSRRARARR